MVGRKEVEKRKKMSDRGRKGVKGLVELSYRDAPNNDIFAFLYIKINILLFLVVDIGCLELKTLQLCGRQIIILVSKT